MATITVSNASELQSALDAAKGGDKIVLKNGNYGDFSIQGEDYSQKITIEAQNDLKATFTRLEVFDSSNIRIDGVKVARDSNGSPAAKLVTIDEGSSKIDFVNSEVHGKIDKNSDGYYGIHVRDATDVLIKNNYVHDVQNGGVYIGADDIQVIGNTYDRVGHDSMKFGSNDGVLIEGNVGARTYFPTEGAHKDFIQFQAGAKNITIRDNVFIPESVPNVQGIFLSDGSFSNVLIENNIVYTGMLNAVVVENGSGITVQNNTLLNIPGLVHKSAAIIVPGGSTVKDNVIGTNNQGGASGNGNIKVQYEDPSKPYYYGDMFKNAMTGLGATVEDLQPKDNTPVALGKGKGAEDLFSELLDKPLKEYPDPEPEPTPDPTPDPEPTPEPDPGSSPSPTPSNAEFKMIADEGDDKTFFGKNGGGDKLSTSKGISVKFTVPKAIDDVSEIESAVLKFKSADDRKGDTHLNISAKKSLDDVNLRDDLDDLVDTSINIDISERWEKNERVGIDITPVITALLEQEGPLEAGDTISLVVHSYGMRRNISEGSFRLLIDDGAEGAIDGEIEGEQSIFIGGSNTDELTGGGLDDSIFGGLNRDTLEGAAGEDTLQGGKGRDDLYGGQDSDVLVAGKGRDTLEGGEGDDTLYGSGGDDTFVFRANWGDDVIHGYSAAKGGGETLDFSQHSGVSGLEDLTLTKQGKDILIEYQDDSILLDEAADIDNFKMKMIEDALIF